MNDTFWEKPFHLLKMKKFPQNSQAASHWEKPAAPPEPGYSSLARNSPMRRVPSSMFCRVTG
jgi:hypothetical protein